MPISMIRKVLANLLSKPFTIDYPKKKSRISVNFRGRIHIDQKKCISCKLCELNCPTGAIVVDKAKKYAVVDLGKCILCGLCSEVCPVNVIWFSKEQGAFENTKNMKKQFPGKNPAPGSRSVRKQ